MPSGPSAYKSIGGMADTLAANHLQAILVDAQGARVGDTDPQAGVPHRFRIYAGAHNHAFWNRHDDEWLTAAVRRLETPR